jgi:hypothetical protein
MNKKQKILTIAALAVFGVIIVLHSIGAPYYEHSYWNWKKVWHPELKPAYDPNHPFDDLISANQGRWQADYVLTDGGLAFTKPWWEEDVHMPLFVLAVFYTGLFFLLATQKHQK